jgi:hypothetical protein
VRVAARKAVERTRKKDGRAERLSSTTVTIALQNKGKTNTGLKRPVARGRALHCNLVAMIV